MSVLAAIRPDAWNFPLLLHVLGAMVLVGALVLSTSALVLAWRTGAPALVRLGIQSLLLGVFPGWILMRVGAEWIASKEDLTDAKLSWLDVGFTTADGGVVLIIVAMVLAGLAVRRRGGSMGLSRALAVLASVLLIAYLVAIWAMTTKPT
jgi:hypothetical protein